MKTKISIIMQSYLADYPGSRSNPEYKFIRAVYSIIGQTANNWELVIISDGCTITESLYKKYFSNYRNIIFERINKHAGSDMQEKHERIKYRIPGSPMARGLELASGDWITYFGSDDFLVKNAVSTLTQNIEVLTQQTPELRYIVNKSRVEHSSWDAEKSGLYSVDLKNIKIEGVPSIWNVLTLKNSISVSNSMLIHKRGYPEHMWSDEGDYAIPRDTIYFRKILRDQSQQQYIRYIKNPYYVRCHTRPGDITVSGWDF